MQLHSLPQAEAVKMLIAEFTGVRRWLEKAFRRRVVTVRLRRPTSQLRAKMLAALGSFIVEVKLLKLE